MNSRGRIIGLLGASTLMTACGSPGPSPAPQAVTAPASPSAASAPAALAAAAATTPGASAKPGTASSPAAPAATADAPRLPSSVAEHTAAAAKAASEALAPRAVGYEIKGRRDPFENLDVTAREKEAARATTGGSAVASAKLTGIVRGQTTLALVETTTGMGYVLKTGDTFGEGRLIEIGADQVVFAVPPAPGSTTNRVVLKIVKD